MSLKAFSSTSSGEVAGSGLPVAQEAKSWLEYEKTGYPTDLEPWTVEGERVTTVYNSVPKFTRTNSTQPASP